MFKMIANGIEVQMFVGICDFEYKEKQKVMVNVTLQGNPKFAPTHITECMDYSKDGGQNLISNQDIIFQ